MVRFLGIRQIRGLTGARMNIPLRPTGSASADVVDEADDMLGVEAAEDVREGERTNGTSNDSN